LPECRNESRIAAFARIDLPWELSVNAIIYLVGLVVIVMFILSVVGLR
jgi:hypothetical protein